MRNLEIKKSLKNIVKFYQTFLKKSQKIEYKLNGEIDYIYSSGEIGIIINKKEYEYNPQTDKITVRRIK